MLNKNIHIVGLSGAEGSAIVQYLVKKGFSNITVHDFCTEKEFAKNLHLYHQEYNKEERMKLLRNIKSLPIKFQYKDSYLEGIDQADILYLPQSWYLYKQNSPIQCEIDRGVVVRSLMHFYLKLGNAIKIGITGSNGKTTTANLVYNMLKSENKKVYLVGNDRKNEQVLNKVESLIDSDILIMEISNRHLKMNYDTSPEIAVITNISQNHLNEHDNFEDYKNTKLKIFQNQKKGDCLVVRKEEKEEIGNVSSDIVVYNSEENIRQYVENIDWDKVKLKGEHNRENIYAAISVAKKMGVSNERIKETLYTFSAMSKRMEEMYKIDDRLYINDLSSTTPESTILAIDNYKDSFITLILGGENKNLELKELVKKINSDVDAIIYHKGTLSNGVVDSLDNTKTVLESACIEDTISKAQSITPEGGVVLFSPVGEGFISGILKNRNLKNLIEKVTKK